jgi:sulfur carrier protein
VILNGTDVTFEGTVAQLVADRFGTSAGRGIAVAINGMVVARSAWEATVLVAGDRVDIVTAVQGG